MPNTNQQFTNASPNEITPVSNAKVVTIDEANKINDNLMKEKYSTEQIKDYYSQNNITIDRKTTPETEISKTVTESPTFPKNEPVNQIKEQIAFTNEIKDKTKDLYNSQIKANEEQKKADEARAISNAKANEDLINKANEEQAKVEAEKIARLEAEKKQELDLLNQEKKNTLAQAENQRAELEAQANLQRKQNESAIIQANSNIALQQQQSAWAFQKLWLWFSSGIINQSQQIATDWFAKIAEIKATMNYQEALIWSKNAELNLQLENISSQYTRQINSTISSYSDKIDDIQQQTTDRINNTQASLLMNSQEKNKVINDILKEYRATKNTLESWYLQDMVKIQETWYNYQKELNAAIEDKRQRKLTDLTQEIMNWNIGRMSSTEIANKEAELWLSTGTIRQKVSSVISTSLRNMYDTILWQDVVIDNPSQLLQAVNTEMSQGRTLEEAVNIIWNRAIKSHPNYQLKKKREDEQIAMQKQEMSLRQSQIANEYDKDWAQLNAKGVYSTNTPSISNETDLLNFISDAEWTHWNYNAMYWKWWQTTIKLTDMTLKEIQDLQRRSIYKDKNWNYVWWAMWKYQIVTGTLNNLIKSMGLTWNEKFTPELQDKMAKQLLWDAYGKYQRGEISASQLQNKVSGIWMGVANSKWISSVNDWTNKPTAKWKTFMDALKKWDITQSKSEWWNYIDYRIMWGNMSKREFSKLNDGEQANEIALLSSPQKMFQKTVELLKSSNQEAFHSQYWDKLLEIAKDWYSDKSAPFSDILSDLNGKGVQKEQAKNFFMNIKSGDKKIVGDWSEDYPYYFKWDILMHVDTNWFDEEVIDFSKIFKK